MDPISLEDRKNLRSGFDRRTPLSSFSHDKDSQGGLSVANIFRVIRRRRRPFLLTLVLFTTYNTIQTLKKIYLETQYEGSFSILISEPIDDRPTVNNGSDEAALDTVARNTATTDIPTLLEVLQSPVVLGDVFRQLNQQGISTKESPQISVTQVPAQDSKTGATTKVLRVTGRGANPIAVEQGLRLTEKAYLKWSSEQRQERLKNGLRYLASQEPELAEKQREIENELQSFRNQRGSIFPKEQASSLNEQVGKLEVQLTVQSSERGRLEQMKRRIQQGKLVARTFGGAPVVPTDTTILNVNLPNQSAIDEMDRLTREVEIAKSTYTPGSRMIRDLERAQARLKPEVQRRQVAAVEAALSQNANALEATRQQLQRIRSELQKQPGLLKEYETLENKVRVANDNYNRYLKTREQFKLELAQRDAPWMIIAPTGVSRAPAELSLIKGIFQGLLMGTVLGSGVALIRDRLDNVFHSPQDVRDGLGVRLLGHMPYVAFFDGVRRDNRFLLKELDDSRDQRNDYQRFFYQESLRNLYTSLRFVNSNRSMRSVAITSSIPEEGKSLLTVLMAKTLSEMGQRVLLVDGDMRRPQIHYRLGLENSQGLSNALQSDSTSIHDCIQSVAGYPNWKVISAGSQVDDPPRLLASKRMADVMDELGNGEEFDLVLYDTPQALGIADAALLAGHLEGIVLLVGLNRVDRSLPKEAIARIREAHVPLLGIVTNALRPRGEGAAFAFGSGYGYRHFSHYGGYGGFDPGSAYSLYQDGGTIESKDNVDRFSEKISRYRSRLNQWLDG